MPHTVYLQSLFMQKDTGSDLFLKESELDSSKEASI